MAKKLSQAQKDKIATKQKDSWKDPSKRMEQKKRIEAKRLLKATSPDRIESPDPLNIEAARQALIDEIKKLDEQLAKFEPLVQKRDKLSSILEELNNLRERQSVMNEAAKKRRSYQYYPPFADNFAGFSSVFPGLPPYLIDPASSALFLELISPRFNLLRRRASFIPKKGRKK